MDNENGTLAVESDLSGVDASRIASDWGGSPDSAPAEAQGDADQRSPDNQEPADNTGTQTEAEPADDKTEVKETKTEADQSFTLKHLEDVMTVGRDEVIALAQKGLDRDRQYAKNAELSAKLTELAGSLSKADDAIAVLKEIAEPQGQTLEQVIDAIRADLLTRTGILPEAAAERVRLQREARNKPAPVPERSPDDVAAERRATDIREFLAEYPSTDPAKIPVDVWASVKGGKSLLMAYQAHELREVKAEKDMLAAAVEAAKRNAENKARTTGSKATAGQTQMLDPYAADWYS